MNNQNFVQPGRILTLAAPYDRLTSGLGALIGSIFGVSMDTVLNGVDGQFETEGVHYLLKTSAQAWTAGDRLFWNSATKLVDNDPTTGQFIGVATAAAANPSASGYIKLAGNAPELAEGKQAAVVVLTDNTGASGTHDDTLADGLTTTAVVGAFTGAVDGTVEDVAATASAVVGGATPTAAQVDTGIALAVSTIVSGTNLQLAELAAKIGTLTTDMTVNNQNVSDLAQKLIEIRAVLVTAGLITA